MSGKTLLSVAGVAATSMLGLVGTASADATTYQVKSGDTLSRIAYHNHISVADLKKLNHLTSDMIFPGQKLSFNRQNNAPSKLEPATKAVTYTIKSGDTASAIAKQFHMSVSELQTLNQSMLSNINVIQVGQRLVVSGAQAPATTPAVTAKASAPADKPKYTVRAGDTLGKIAREHGMSVSALLSANQLSAAQFIFPGQQLSVSQTMIPQVEQKQAVKQQQATVVKQASDDQTVYLVKRGDTLSKIASTHQMSLKDLLVLNHLQYQNPIYPGQSLILSKTAAPVADVVAPQVVPISTVPASTNQSTVANLSIVQKAWLDFAIDDAVRATSGTGVRASITVAQAILESGWGQSTLSAGPNYNLFGIKADRYWSGPKVMMKTGEYINHKYVTVDAPFRVYASQEASFRDHTAFLLQNGRYAANGVINSNSYQSMAIGLQKAGYATDPNYASTLISVVERYNLARLDQ